MRRITRKGQFASRALVFKHLNETIKEETNGRVKVHKVQCWEHGENMAEYRA